MCPNLTKVAEIVLCLPVSNACPVQGASKVELMKTSSRNRLQNDMLQGLLQIQINGPELRTKKWDHLMRVSVQSWRDIKSRR